MDTIEAGAVKVGDWLEPFGIVERIEGLDGKPIPKDAPEQLLVFVCAHPASSDEQRARFGPTRPVQVKRA